MKVQFEHHSLAVEALAKQVEAEGIFDALIITGSVPRGTARPGSDIDCYVLVGDEECERRRDATTMTVRFGARAVLAHNRMLFPCPKQLLATLDDEPEQPTGFADNIDRLLAEPTDEGFATHLELLGNFTDWGIDGMDVLTRFMELDEWTWWSGTAELAQR